MKQAFAFISRNSGRAGNDAADDAAGAVPAWLYRSEAFVEDLDLMPAPQPVRRTAIAQNTADSAGRAHRFSQAIRPMSAGLRWSAVPTA